MKLVFRVDSSSQIGAGHVMRCLALAQECRKSGADVLFVCRPMGGDLREEINKRGFSLLSLPELKNEEYVGRFEEIDAAQTVEILEGFKADWLVLDHYQLGLKWEKRMLAITSRIMVIDDLADRLHYCDILLDQNYYESPETRYVKLVPEHCQPFLGPKYALLREEFLNSRPLNRSISRDNLRLLIFFGGSDPTDETGKALEAVSLLDTSSFEVDVVVGVGNPLKNDIQSKCSYLPNVNYHCQVSNMAALMRSADLALGAGGSATWERCFLGLPALVIIIADNQLKTTQALANAGAVACLGRAEDISSTDIAQAISDLFLNVNSREKMSCKSMQIMGGDNFLGAKAIVREMFS